MRTGPIRSRIFDPFFRATRTDRVIAGSGLGLAICRGLTNAMGGRIAAESPFLSAVLPPVALRAESISFAVS